MQNKKILILTGSFGNGHISVTNSIVNQFNEMNLKSLNIIEHDLFLEAHPVITNIAKKYYLNSYKYFRKSYKHFYYANQNDVDRCFYKYYALNRLINILIKEKPDLILLTFPTPVVSLIKDAFNLNIPVVTVITDYNFHKNWYTPKSERYYVACEKVKNELLNIGVDASRIEVTGIPIHNKFEQKKDRNAWLSQHQLDPSKKTLLMVAGAFGVVEGFNTMLERMSLDHSKQFVVVCGSNQHLLNELKNKFQHASHVYVIGYTQDMDQWMDACDLMLTKPGGITITESLCKAIPLVFFNPAPGQEGENAIYFSNQGYGRITHTYDETVHVVQDLLNHQDELLKLKQNMQLSYKPNAAKVICEDIIYMLNESMMTKQLLSKASLYAKLISK